MILTVTPQRRVHPWLLVSVLPLIVIASGCNTEPGEPDYLEETEALQQACALWSEVACHKNDLCVGITESVEECIASETADCIADAADDGPSCYGNLASALTGCADSLEPLTCTEYCSTSDSGFTFCYEPCYYWCPNS